MKRLRQLWPLLALIGVGWLLWRRPKGQRNPGGQATRDELAYTDYLTNHPSNGVVFDPPLDFDAWAAAGKPKS